MSATSRFFAPESTEQMISRHARDIEQAARDITNIQRQLKQQTGDVLPDAGGGALPITSFLFGKLTSTLTRGGTATLKQWSVNPSGGIGSATPRTDDTIVDASELPTGIILPTGTPYKAQLQGNVWVAQGAEAYFVLHDCQLPGGGIAAGGSGTVTWLTLSLTISSVANNTAVAAASSGWCCIGWNKPTATWHLINFDVEC